jgi:hypothetical protein
MTMFSAAARVGCVKYGEQGLKFGGKNTGIDDHVWQELGKVAEQKRLGTRLTRQNAC